jgi:hypothetical protein
LGDYVFDVLVRIRVQLRERSKRRLNGLGWIHDVGFGSFR